MMNKNSKILIVGHGDIIENGLTDHLISQGFFNVFSSSKIGLNPTIQSSIYEFFQNERPEYIFLASTRSGGIEANRTHPAEFLYHNLESQNNIVYAAHKFGAKKLLFYGASCIYPKECPQPMKEEYLLSGPLEETSQAYSIAKISGIHLCHSYKCQFGFNAVIGVPATVYGPGSDTDIEKAHVMGALIGKFSEAVQNSSKKVTVWGSGNPKREFLYIDDFVEASIFLMDKYDGDHIMNIAAGVDITIRELAETISDVTGFKGEIAFDSSKPDGVPQKLLDNTLISQLGWSAKVDLKEGIQRTYEWYKNRSQ